MDDTQPSLTISFKCEIETLQFGADLALVLQAADCVCLSGPLGAGKSTLARSVIRAMADNDALEVPSPTYTLEQVYETEPRINHYDFYRLKSADEVEELGFFETIEDCVSLIEWPENAAEYLPDNRIDIVFDAPVGEDRKLTISANQSALARIQRTLDIRAFLDSNWRTDVVRKPFSGDASTRRYELATAGEETRVLMDAARQPDGPPIKGGLPYSQVAHLAEDVSAFVAIDQILVERGYQAPTIHAKALDSGILLMDHMGQGQIIDSDRTPIERRYVAAVELLARMHSEDWPHNIQLAKGYEHQIARYDGGVIQIETELLTDWYMPDIVGRACSHEQKREFKDIWADLAKHLETMPHSLVLRDFHSPNIIWRDEKSGDGRLGLIDFQDALIGPQSYDVASLAQDARVTVSAELEAKLVDRYLSARMAFDDQFDGQEFRESYAIMAAQRATKILGIFVRLHKRDNKPAYRQHIPRMRDYLERSFEHRVLKRYREWFDRTINDTG